MVGCTFSIVLTAIGSGIISVPYAACLLHSFEWSIILNLFSIIIMGAGADMLLRVRRNMHFIHVKKKQSEL